MKRWLLWTLVCRRGRSCANIVVDDFASKDIPSGSIVRLGYVCHGCGTVYEAEFLVAEDDALVALGRERLTAKRVLERGRQAGVEIGGGEAADIFFFGRARNDGDAEESP